MPSFVNSLIKFIDKLFSRYKSPSGINIWSAGCSRGQEPYSIAILLAELTSLRQQHYILATDLDRAALAHAKAGGPYNESDMTRVSESQLKKHFTSTASTLTLKAW